MFFSVYIKKLRRIRIEAGTETEALLKAAKLLKPKESIVLAFLYKKRSNQKENRKETKKNDILRIKKTCSYSN